MRAVVSLVVITVLASNAWATVTARVYLADEETPLAWALPNTPDLYRDIMVGTHLTIFIESDTLADLTSGVLTIPTEDQEQGFLAGRGPEGSTDYPDSCLEAVGDSAEVLSYSPMKQQLYFQFNTRFQDEPGRWFVFDYYATDVGYCDVNYYEYSAIIIVTPPAYPDPEDLGPGPLRQTLSFHHVKSRDFNDDKIVNFADFAYLASKWNQSVVADPNEIVPPDPNAVFPPDPNTIRSLDLSDDGFIDANDIWRFSDYWLERTDVSEPNEPNATDPSPPLEAL